MKRPTKKQNSPIGFGMLLIILADLGIWASVFLEPVSWQVGLLLHAGLGALGFLLLIFGWLGGSYDPLGLFFVFSLGPLGAVGMMLVAFIVLITPEDQDRTYDWYETLSQSQKDDEVSILYRQIVNGRSRRPGKANLESFSEVMRSGTIKQKQALLGVIALKYQPEFRHFLRLALKDGEAPVRVQAAAVSTKLQDQFKARLAAIEPEIDIADMAKAQTQLEEMCAIARSGFIDASKLIKLRERIQSYGSKFGKDMNNPDLQRDISQLGLIRRSGPTAHAGAKAQTLAGKGIADMVDEGAT